MDRTRLLWTAILLLTFAGAVFAQDTKFPPQGEQIPGPDTDASYAGQCCYRTEQIKNPTQAFKTWIEDIRWLLSQWPLSP